jgi:MYXO-CTERM domain-containing protein
VLQVLQIMLNHPVNPPNNVPGAGFTYHHCAFIAIEPGADGGTQPLAQTGDADATAHAGTGSGGGCSCSTTRAPKRGAIALLAGLAVALAFVRRVRRAQR